MKTQHISSHATADSQPRFPASSPLRDRILGEEITMTVRADDGYGNWWGVLVYEGGWREWTPMWYLENLFDEGRRLNWHGKSIVHRHFIEYVTMILGCIQEMVKIIELMK